MKINSIWSYITKKKFLFSALLVLVIIGGSLTYWYPRHKTASDDEVPFQSARVSQGNITVGFESDGNISYSKVNLGFGVDGAIAEVLVATGDSVKKGAIIAKLESSDYQDKYQLAMANLTNAQEQKLTDLQDLELKLKNGELELEKLRDSYQEMEALPDAYSANEVKLLKLELDAKETEYQNLKQKYESESNKALTQEELTAKMAWQDLEDTILYAPVSGVILSLSKKVGERVSEDEDFAVIHDNNTVKAKTSVIEYDIGQITLGQKVYVTAEALPDNQFTGHVTHIETLPAEDSSGLVNYEVEIEIADPVSELKDGMTATITFLQKEVSRCLIIPYQAVSMVDGQQIVTVKDQEGNLTTKNIQAGFSDGSSVEVIEGLSPGETVVYRKSR